MRRRRGSSTQSVSRSVVRSDPLLDRIFASPLLPVSLPRSVVRSVEDRRTFHPLRTSRPAAALPRAASRLVVKSSAVNHFRDNLSARVGFAVPERVAVCVRRKERREVIHAIGRAGGGGSRRRRRNNWSDVIC